MVDEYTVDREIYLPLSKLSVIESDSRIQYSFPDNENFIHHWNLAYTCYDSADFKGSSENFQQALSLYPSHYLSLLGLAKAYIGDGELKDAYDICKLLTNRAPDDYRGWYWMARAFSQGDKSEIALKCLDSASARNGDLDMRVWYERVNVYTMLERDKKAEECALYAIELDDSSPLAWEALGRNYMAMFDYHSAIECYSKAIQLETRPELVQQWVRYLYRGFLFKNRNNFPDAIADFSICLEKFPENFATLKRVGFCYLMVSDYKQSLACYQKAYVHDSVSLDVLYGLAKSNTILGNNQQAQLIYERCLELYPRDVPTLCGFAWNYMWLGDFEEAIRIFDSCWAIDTTDYSVVLGKACALNCLYRFNLSADYYKKYIDKVPDLSNAWWGYAGVLWGAQKKMSALRGYDSCLKYDNTHISAWYDKSRLLNELGRIDEADRCLDSAYSHGLIIEEEGSPIKQLLRNFLGIDTDIKTTKLR